MKTLTTVNWITEADSLRALLESGGIEVFVPDENLAAVNPLYGTAMGGVRIQVRDDDYGRALEIARDWMEARGQDLNPCPACDSLRVEARALPWKRTVLSLLLLGIPLLWTRRRYRCADCGQEWEQDRTPADLTPSDRI